jgi:CubicO group peptidase (beta-lactamase class C family)
LCRISLLAVEREKLLDPLGMNDTRFYVTDPEKRKPIANRCRTSVGGTFFFIAPKDDMFTIVMMQSPSQRGRIETEVKRLVYEALEN